MKSLRARRSWLRFAVLDSTGSATSSTGVCNRLSSGHHDVELKQVKLFTRLISHGRLAPLWAHIWAISVVLAPFSVVAGAFLALRVKLLTPLCDRWLIYMATAYWMWTG